ncbi:MerR family transcriptional regulator [Nocardioides sp. AX2bis]|uniref:MerR family transcriptional regulator n=1 Tax=Nocardioides sp. AX2bis TaxID=2653157 RepID=UPI0012EFD4F9|nr:B12-binding domain-containing protein [Nocardioides sp. AX2bis]VXC58029.1 Transcriptional regulator, MerR family [Nocardioides sp. AX2bis]
MPDDAEDGAAGPGERWRIGVLAGRVGVTETLLRAWELRYGLLSPVRTPSGYRLYGPEDERRIRAMVAARQRGVPAARAAAEVLSAERSSLAPGTHDAVGAGTGTDDDAVAREELKAAMVGYDVSAMHDTIDRVLRTVSVEAAIRDVLLPFMHDVGLGWSTGDYDVADEHFATEVVRSRLAALTVGGAPSTGPLVLLACPPGEAHDLALKAFEVILQRAGWRTRFLGTQTPTRSLLAAAEIVDPDLVVLAATRRAAFNIDDEALRELRRRWPLALAGAGADAALAEAWGATHLSGDPVAGAQQLVPQRGPATVRPTAPERPVQPL